MKLKVTLGSRGAAVDLSLTCDAATTVGDIADHLRAADPRRPRPTGAPSARLTLAVGEAGATRLLDPGLSLVESGLRSGSRVELRPAAPAGGADQRPSVGTLVVVEGPDLGRELPLRAGTNVVGRSPSCDVRLSDGLVSREHVRLNLTGAVEVVDLGSANGVQVNGTTVTRTTLRSGDQVRLGDTAFVVRVHRRPSADQQADSGFLRSPRLVPRHDGTQREAPEVAEPAEPQRFPYLTLVAPVLLGAVLYLLTRQLYTLLFIALSPLMLVAHHVESRWEVRRAARRQRDQLSASLAALVAEVRADHGVEQTVRRLEHPSTAEVVDATRRHSPLLWTRRPGRPGFAELRLGSATQPSRSSIRTSAARRGAPELRAEVDRTLDELSRLDDVPVAARLLEGPLGIAGPRVLSLAAARAVLLQAAGLHSPDELVLCVVSGPDRSGDWDWVKWLPHCGSVASPLTSPSLADGAAQVGALLSELESLVRTRQAEAEARHETDDAGPPLPVVQLVVEHESPADLARLVALCEAGSRVGVVSVWVAEETSQLPAVCSTSLSLESPEEATVTDTVAGLEARPVRPELVDADTAESTARRLCPVVDLSAQREDASDLPRSVSLLELIGPDLAVSPAAAIQRWAESRSLLTGPYAPAEPVRGAGTLRAVVGQSAGDVHVLDLRAQGPHALVGGTTGSGKSELLQTWILSMAASHSPQRLTVLLVDYKGGAAFAECRDLPHTVGMVTDLDPKGVRRALESLRAELRHREHVLARHGAKDLMDLEKRGIAETPPSLVIVVDEFAALASEVPEFVEGVVDVAQRGRSLGLHLVLATQRPAGVIKENLRANTNLRVALRMAETDDSRDVLGTPDAAYFDQEVPGRAVSKVGPGRLTSFQTAYVGGTTAQGQRDHDIAVEELGFAAGRRWERDVLPTGPRDPDQSDLTRVVRCLTQASELAQLPVPRKPWLPELETHYDLADTTVVQSRRRDSEVVFGVADAPFEQAQPMVGFRPDVEGNLAVFGAGGAGKSVLLRTIAASLAFVRRGPAHVYGLDFGARGLTMLEPLPHVGAVVVASDEERVRRLLDWLRHTLDERAARYAEASAGTITDYRERSGRTDEPRLVLLLDGLAAFRSAYESDVTSKVWENFLTVATDGRPLGLHLVVTADRPGTMPTTLAAAVQRRVVLRMADRDDYALLGVPRDVLDEKSPPGRGVVDRLEVQVALLGQATDTAGQTKAMERLAAAMRPHAGAPPQPIERLSSSVAMSDLPASVGEAMTIGLASETLDPVGIPQRGAFMITGPPGSGRSTALLAVAAALGRTRPTVARVMFASRPGLLVGQTAVWSHQAVGPDRCHELATQLLDELQQRPGTEVAIFVQGLADLVGTLAESSLSDVFKACDEAGGMFVAEAQPSVFNVGYGLPALLRANRTGMALQPGSGDGFAFGATFPNRLDPVSFPVGRGLLVLRGSPQVVQVMRPRA